MFGCLHGVHDDVEDAELARGERADHVHSFNMARLLSDNVLLPQRKEV